jgi:prevent-host-death family protein
LIRLSIAEAKARFSEVIREVQAGQDVIVTKGTGKEPVAAVIPIGRYRGGRGRVLGLARDWGAIRIGPDWAMDEEALLES